MEKWVLKNKESDGNTGLQKKLYSCFFLLELIL